MPAPAPPAEDEATDDDDPADVPPEAANQGRRTSYGARIREVLAAAGEPLTYLEIAAASGVDQPDGGVPARMVRYLLARWAVSGVRTTTKDGKVAGEIKPRRRPAAAREPAPVPGQPSELERTSPA